MLLGLVPIINSAVKERAWKRRRLATDIGYTVLIPRASSSLECPRILPILGRGICVMIRRRKWCVV